MSDRTGNAHGGNDRGELTESGHRAVEYEARTAGLRGFAPPTLEAVDRRRSELWTMAFAGLVCLAAGVAILTSGNGHHLGIANSIQFRVGTVALVVALAAYVIDKEHHLRRLAQMLVNERVVAEAMSDRLKELTTLCEAGEAMNSMLLIEEVLKLILSSAFELLEASSGSIMLLEDPDTLAAVCAVGDTAIRTRIKVGEELAGGVARRRVPSMIQGRVSDRGTGPVESALCVPLIHRDVLFGVLELRGSPERVYNEFDVRAVSLFAGHAAIAIANARLYDSERELNTRLSAALLHRGSTRTAHVR